MSKDIAVSAGKGAVARPANVDPGQGTDIGGLSFSGRALTYDEDMPTVFRPGAKNQALALREAQATPGAEVLLARDARSPMSERDLKKIAKATIASGVRQLDKPRRSMGRIVQRRIGWKATPTQIMVTTAERELTRRQDGKLTPAGEWMIEHRQTFTNKGGAAEKRVGKIAHTTESAASQPTTATPGGPGTASAVRDTFPEGQFALSLLPAQVRSSVIARVPVPSVFDGSVMMISDAATGAESHKEVNVIRMDAARAVVVQARLTPRTGQWDVSQATYTLSDPDIEQV